MKKNASLILSFIVIFVLTFAILNNCKPDKPKKYDNEKVSKNESKTQSKKDSPKQITSSIKNSDDIKNIKPDNNQKDQENKELISNDKKLDKFKWYNFTEGYKLAQKLNKLIFIDIYADWCGYCKLLDKNVFSKKKVQDAMLENYIPVKLDVESEKKVSYFGEMVYPGQIAVTYIGEDLGLPTCLVMNNEGAEVDTITGYVSSKTMIRNLNEIAEYYKEQVEEESDNDSNTETPKKNISSKEDNPKKNEEESLKKESINSKHFKWFVFSEGQKKAEKENKLIFIDIYADWCGYCKLLERDVFSKNEFKTLMNKHYVPVKLDTEARQKIDYFGKKLYPAQVIAKYLGIRYGLPTCLVIDKNGKQVELLRGYLPLDVFVKKLKSVVASRN